MPFVVVLNLLSLLNLLGTRKCLILLAVSAPTITKLEPTITKLEPTITKLEPIITKLEHNYNQIGTQLCSNLVIVVPK